MEEKPKADPKLYEDFKRELLEGMETKRDILVLENARKSGVSAEPFFEITGTDDKLYERIFRSSYILANLASDKLLYKLCQKYNINFR